MWRLDGSLAHLRTHRLDCDVDLLRPSAGLLNLSPNSGFQIPPDLKIVEIDTGEAENETTLIDAFVRGTDLVATYGETGKRSVRSQVYWRSIHLNEYAFGVDVILSVQTSKLDGSAALEIASVLPTNGERWPADESSSGSLYRFALPACSHRYVEIVHPSNLASTTLEPDQTRDRWRLSHGFFPGRLEKGVIHRAMLRAVFLTAEQSPQLEQLYREFIEAPPPLST